MFYTLDSWNRILHLGSQTCGIRVARPSRNKRKRNDPEGHASTVQRARVRRRISRRRGRGRRKRKRGVRYTWPGTARPISPVRPNSARDQKPWPLSLSLSLFLFLFLFLFHRVSCTLLWLQFMAVITSIGPWLGLNDLFVCTVHFIGPALRLDRPMESLRHLPIFTNFANREN